MLAAPPAPMPPAFQGWPDFQAASISFPSTIPMTSFFASGHLSKPGGFCAPTA